MHTSAQLTLTTLSRIPGSGERVLLTIRTGNQDNPSQTLSEANLSVDSLSQACPETFLLGVEMTVDPITGVLRGLEAILSLNTTENQFIREWNDCSTV